MKQVWGDPIQLCDGLGPLSTRLRVDYGREVFIMLSDSLGSENQLSYEVRWRDGSTTALQWSFSHLRQQLTSSLLESLRA
jgi:hypothetical protein